MTVEGATPSLVLAATWERQRVWSQAANRLKTGMARWRTIALVLAVSGAIEPPAPR